MIQSQPQSQPRYKFYKLKQLTIGVSKNQSLESKGDSLIEFIQRSPNQVFISQAKLMCQIFQNYSKKLIYSNLTTQVNNLLMKFIKILTQRRKKMAIVWPSQLMYIQKIVNKKLSNKQTKMIHSQKLEEYQSSSIDKVNITLQNYTKQCLLKVEIKQELLNLLIVQLTNFNIQTVNPICIGCSEYIKLNQLKKTSKSYERTFISTICERKEIPKTGQYYSVICGVNNSELEPQLIRAMITALNANGGYILINGTNEHRIEGIEEDKSIYQNIYQKISQAFYEIQPALHTNDIKVQKIYVVPSLLQNCSMLKFQNFNFQKKFIIKFQIKPKRPYLFYEEHRAKQNKSILNFYSEKNGKIHRIIGQQIYTLICDKYRKTNSQSNTHYPCLSFLCGNVCLPLCKNIQLKQKHESQMIIQKSKFIQKNLKSNQQKVELAQETQFLDGKEEEPIIKYKNCTIFAVTNKKNQQWLVNLLKKALIDKKIPCYLTKPYKNYSLVSERSLYVLNHVCDFSLLNKIHNEIDKDGKARLVIVNKCIQIKSKLAQNKKDRFMLAFQSIFVNDSKYEEKTERPLIVERQQKIPGTGGQWKIFTFIKLETIKQAIFSYIYLDNLSIRCQLVKEAYFEEGYKQKNN